MSARHKGRPPRNIAAPAKRRGQVAVARERDAEPRLPHEHDESADSQAQASGQQREVGRKAFDDLQAARVDTDLGPVLEELFRTHLQSSGPPAGKRRRPR
ncbi:MAG TPA: hypothetical protein VFU71_20240 [Burkholderiaceae bacterium]|nr:hypothetical protein [Burkholderiaceae bacterium]